MNIDLLIHDARLVTCAGPDGPKRGAAMRDVGLIDEGALAIHDGTIVALGPTAELEARYNAELTIDVHGRAVCPGFVDPHTHVVYAGDRIDEFEQRIQGATYLEIMAPRRRHHQHNARDARRVARAADRPDTQPAGPDAGTGHNHGRG